MALRCTHTERNLQVLDRLLSICLQGNSDSMGIFHCPVHGSSSSDHERFDLVY